MAEDAEDRAFLMQAVLFQLAPEAVDGFGP
jgi:hypothetical protein